VGILTKRIEKDEKQTRKNYLCEKVSRGNNSLGGCKVKHKAKKPKKKGCEEWGVSAVKGRGGEG